MWWKKAGGSKIYDSSEEIPAPDVDRSLRLFMFEACHYCKRVFSALEKLQMSVEMADVRKDTAVRQELYSLTGRTQVPCLIIDDVPLFESEDICAWLEAYAARGTQTS